MALNIDFVGDSVAKYPKRAMRYLEPQLMANESFENFRVTKYTFRIAANSEMMLSLDKDNPSEEEKRAMVTDLMELFRVCLEKVKERGGLTNDYVHIYLDLGSGSDFRFSYNKSIKHGATLEQLIEEDSRELTLMMEEFADRVQSGNDVTLNDECRIHVYTMSVPKGGAQHKRVRADNRETVLHNLRSVLNLRSDNLENENDCLAQALMLCYLNTVEDNTAPRDFKKARKSIIQVKSDGANQVNVTPAFAKEVRELIVAAKTHDERGLIVFRQPIPFTATDLFAQVLNCNVHVYAFAEGGSGGSWIHHAHIGHGHEHLYVLLDKEHYHPILSSKTFLRTVHCNQRATFCTTCYQVKDSRSEHVCIPYDPNTPNPVIDNSVVTVASKQYFKPDRGDCEKLNEYIKKKEIKKAFNSVFIAMDLETRVVGYLRDPPHTEEPVEMHRTSNYDGILPFEERVLDPAYNYVQEVVYGCWEASDGKKGDFTTLDEFMDVIKQKEYKDAVVLCHNGGKYDFQLLLKHYFSKYVWRTGGTKPLIMSGNKIIMGEIYNGVRLLDFYQFVAAPLSQLPSMFGLEEGLSKGHYPYLLDQKKYAEYKGLMPDLRWYEPDVKKPKQREALIKWHAEQVDSKKWFDLKEERKAYCQDDVKILMGAVRSFRELYMGLESNGRSIGADPLQHLTIASLVFNGVYLTHFLPQNTIGVVKPRVKDQYSWKSIACFEHIMERDGVHIQHACNGGEVSVYCPSLGRHLKVDGYDHENATVYQFHGDFYHACPRHTDLNQPVPGRFREFITNKGEKKKIPVRYGNLLADTKKKDKAIRESPEVYKLITIWECEFDSWKVKVDTDELHNLKPLVPRDAYFGGNTSPSFLYWKCKGPERIHYMDVVSMYPSVLADPRNAYPIGHPIIYHKGDPEMPSLENAFGVIKCKVRPPNDAYFPVLPDRSSTGKVIYSCQEKVGTWVTEEVKLAVRMGYTLLDTYEIHHFTESSTELWKDYIDCFFEIKNKAKQENNPGLKVVAKLSLNALYGRMGFNPSSMSSVKHVHTAAQFYSYLCGNFEGITMDVINDQNCLLHIKDQHPFTVHHASNVYIAAFVTAYARMQLYSEGLRPMWKNTLYYDTDSIVYVSPTGEQLISPELVHNDLGGWESEVGDEMIEGKLQRDWFTTFTAVAPKSYGLLSKSGNNDVVKSKGFHLHFRNAQIMTFDALKDQAEAMANGISQAELAELTLHAGDMKMDKELFNIKVSKNKGKTMHRSFDKRRILPPVYDEEGELRFIETLPFGYAGGTRSMEEYQGVFQIDLSQS